jgi:hypothetical protein
MSRLSKPHSGKKLPNQPKGAPLFYAGRRLPRVITSNPWAFLRTQSRGALDQENAARASAYIDQAFDFFEAAANPRKSSRPLLYYYSFLNLAKVVILHKRGVRLPLAVKHGLRDAKANVKKRLRFEGQKVQFSNIDRGSHSEFFPELILTLGGSAALCGRSFRVVDLLGQIPGIHRTYCSVVRTRPNFMPIKEIEFFSDGKKVWALLRIESSKKDKDVGDALPELRRRDKFKSLFHQVTPDKKDKDETWFMTDQVPGSGRGIDKAIERISRELRSIGIYAILTHHGYRYYLANISPKCLVPQLCSIYAVMFYLGSITRYKPHDFEKIVSRNYEWLVAEFLETQPMQFLYLLASHIAGVEVVKPFAVVRQG